jgi:hypothetical protein
LFYVHDTVSTGARDNGRGLCCIVLLVPTPKVYRVPRISPGVHRTQTVCADRRRGPAQTAVPSSGSGALGLGAAMREPYGTRNIMHSCAQATEQNQTRYGHGCSQYAPPRTQALGVPEHRPTQGRPQQGNASLPRKRLSSSADRKENVTGHPLRALRHTACVRAPLVRALHGAPPPTLVLLCPRELSPRAVPVSTESICACQRNLPGA